MMHACGLRRLCAERHPPLRRTCHGCSSAHTCVCLTHCAQVATPCGQAYLAALWVFNFGAVMAWMPWMYRWHLQPDAPIDNEGPK